MLMGTDVLEGWAPVTMGNNFYITLETEREEEAENMFNPRSTPRQGGARWQSLGSQLARAR